MSHNNVAIFIPHIGCPNMCSFCNQRSISGQQIAPTAKEVIKTCEQAFNEITNKTNTEIAFFGGSFTAIPLHYMLELLECVQPFIGEGKFKGIRISTRPDCINTEILDILKKYKVTSIELGTQSMNDKVLKANNRGHNVEDIYSACGLIKEYGFELGLQIMLGLYKSTKEIEYSTMEQVIKIHPQTIRIYPITVLEGTKLAELYKQGIYKLYSFEEAIEICAEMLRQFKLNDITVIRCGLHASDGIEAQSIAGFYHPAFKELCENQIYKNAIQYEIKRTVKPYNPYIIKVNTSCISKAIGQKKINIEYFKAQGINIKIKADSNIGKYECKLEEI